MTRFSLCCAMVACAIPGTAAAQAATATSSPLPPLHIQYDQIREFLAADAPLPGPDAFEQEYAKVKASLGHPPPVPNAHEIAARELAAIKADQLKQRFADMARGMAMSVFGDLEGALSQANPIAGMVVNRLASRAEAKVEAQQFRHEQTEIQRRSTARAARSGSKVALASLQQLPGLQRISILGSEVRIDNPADDTAVVYKPATREYLVIDNAHKLYRISHGAPPTRPAMFCDGTLASFESLGPREVDGLRGQGYREQIRTTIADAGMSTETMRTFVLWNTPVPVDVLAIASGQTPCPAESPVVGGHFPVNRLVLYGAVTPQIHSLDPDDQGSVLANMHGPQSVRMRGHLRQLTDADRALFEPPPGYTQVQ